MRRRAEGKKVREESTFARRRLAAGGHCGLLARFGRRLARPCLRSGESVNE
jgi:hypothetical protein